MNTQAKTLIRTMLLTVALAPVADAGVIQGSNVVFAVETADPTNSSYRFTLYQDEGRTDPTSMWFDFDGATLSFKSINLDGGSAWYSTALNEEFSTQSIANGDHPVFFRWNDDGQSHTSNALTVGPGPFYLGARTQYGYWERDDPETAFDEPKALGALVEIDVYGWVLLNNNGGQLEMLDNAMAYDAAGIRVGTTEVVPEPSTLALLGGGAIALFAARRGQRRTLRLR